MPHEFRAILDAPPKLLASVGPLKVAMVIIIVGGIAWVAWRHRTLHRARRHPPAKKKRKKRRT